MAKGNNSEMSAIDQHGCTPLLWVDTHYWTMVVVQQSSLVGGCEIITIALPRKGPVTHPKLILFKLVERQCLQVVHLWIPLHHRQLKVGEVVSKQILQVQILELLPWAYLCIFEAQDEGLSFGLGQMDPSHGFNVAMEMILSHLY